MVSDDIPDWIHNLVETIRGSWDTYKPPSTERTWSARLSHYGQPTVQQAFERLRHGDKAPNVSQIERECRKICGMLAAADVERQSAVETEQTQMWRKVLASNPEHGRLKLESARIGRLLVRCPQSGIERPELEAAWQRAGDALWAYEDEHRMSGPDFPPATGPIKALGEGGSNEGRVTQGGAEQCNRMN